MDFLNTILMTQNDILSLAVGEILLLPCWKNLGSDSTVFIANENGFNEIAGLQSNIPSELLAKVESIENTIAEVGKNVNSSSKKSCFVSEADDGMDSDVTAKARRELQQDAELERFVHRRSKRCGRMPGLLRRFSKKQKRRHLCIVFRIELKRVHEIASL